jgi:hypothetical protein
MLKRGDLVIEREERTDPPAVTLSWSGKSNERDPASFLDGFLLEALARASELGGSVEVRCGKLVFINSSTISCLIAFVRRAAERKVPVVVIYDGSSRWQQLSFEALRVFDRRDGLLLVRPEEPG